MQEWNEVMRKMNALNRFVKKNNDFIRRFTAGVKVVELDASSTNVAISTQGLTSGIYIARITTSLKAIEIIPIEYCVLKKIGLALLQN